MKRFRFFLVDRHLILTKYFASTEAVEACVVKFEEVAAEHYEKKA